MGKKVGRAVVLSLALCGASAGQTLVERNTELLRELQEIHELNPEQMGKIRTIFANSPIIGSLVG